MILKQHLDIDGVTFNIVIRKPPPVDEEGGNQLDKWMRVIVGALEEIKALGVEFAARDQLNDEAHAAFDRWLEDDDDQTFWQMHDNDPRVIAVHRQRMDSASTGETNESHAESARVGV